MLKEIKEIIVVDYIDDYSKLSTEDIAKLSDKVKGIGFLENCPNGTIIGIPVERGSDLQKRVYYPFFSHILMPINSGERAWVLQQGSGLVSYWLSRKVQNNTANDLNFTDDDRARFYSKIKDKRVTSRLFFDSDASGTNIAKLKENSVSRSGFVGEPVVPLRSKSQDLTIQGSNDTAISLKNQGSAGTGTIEIVAGIATTQSQQIDKNSLDYNEVRKPIEKIDAGSSISGELSSDDTSRIIVSKFFNADSYYSITGDDSGGQPCISLKTDGVRIVAKKDLKIVVGEGSDPSSIILKSNGDIIITPSSLGVIKLGGEDATGAILATESSVVTAGKVEAPSIVSTAGGLLGAPTIPATGVFSTKVLVKVN